jgi:hypothetical protein
MNELISNLPFRDYVLRDGVNASLIGELAKSPLHAKTYLDEILKSPPEPKVHFRMGTITHRLVLEPDAPLDDMAVKPEGLDGRSKEGREWLRGHDGKLILSQDEWRACIGMADSILMHPVCRRLFEEGDSEQSLFADYLVQQPKLEGIVQRKSRVDHLPKGNVLVDIKTIGRDASITNFERAIWDWKYYVRASFYIDVACALGIPKSVFIYIAVEKEAPYGVRVFQLKTDAVDAGRAEYQELLALWHKCNSEDQWPGYPQGIELVSLPTWAWKQTKTT